MTDRTPAPPSPYAPVRDEMLKLMDELAREIRLDGLKADQLAQIAERARHGNETEMADGLLAVVRGHRVAVLEGQGRLAAVRARYAGLFLDGA